MNTMGSILKHWRVLTSAFFSVMIVAGAYMLARGVESPRAAEASAESALLQAIATRDSDGDGLTDWEEALYGTDPHNTDTFKLGQTDGEAVAMGLIVPKAIADIKVATSSSPLPTDGSLPPPPAEGTLTAIFAKNIFTLYLSAKQQNGGADLSEADMQNIANEAFGSLSSVITSAPDFKSAKDIKVSSSGLDALKAYAIQAEGVLLKNTSNATTSEINYLKSAVENNDATAIPHIASIAKAYRDSAVGLAALTVPQALVANHLMLVNTLMRMSQVTSDFARVNDDPLATMLALQQYLPVTQSLGAVFIHIGKMYSTAGISFSTDEPGASFVNLVEDITQKP